MVAALSLKGQRQQSRIVRVFLELTEAERRATRGTVLRLAFAIACAYAFLRDVNSRSLQSPGRPYTAEAARALALSFVGKIVTEESHNPQFSTLSSDKSPATLVVYWSLEDEASGLTLRDLGPLHDRFRARNLRIVAVNVDPENRYNDLVAELRYRNFKFELVHDAPAHARMMRRVAALPISFLVTNDGSIKETIIGIDERLRRSHWGMPAAWIEIDSLLPRAPRRQG